MSSKIIKLSAVAKNRSINIFFNSEYMKKYKHLPILFTHSVYHQERKKVNYRSIWMDVTYTYSRLVYDSITVTTTTPYIGKDKYI